MARPPSSASFSRRTRSSSSRKTPPCPPSRCAGATRPSRSSARSSGYCGDSECSLPGGYPCSSAWHNERKQGRDMKRLQDLALSPNQHVALSEVRRRVSAAFDVEAIVLYGSAARGEADAESDVDLLILPGLPLTRPTR